MKSLFRLFLGVFCGFLFGCEFHSKPGSLTSNLMPNEYETSFDSCLASKYGADKYGMKPYVLAFLKKGPNRELDSNQTQELFLLHMKNIERMAENGDLVLAGPFMGEEDLKGIYIFNVKSIAEAEELTNSDPAIQSGYLDMELMQWYGSAGLMGLNDLHKKVSANLVSEG
ncbi:MAG: YciI family protein [Salibacteraceae bacterium]